MFCLYRDVLGPELNRDIYEEALALRATFEPSRTSPSRVDTAHRQSLVVYDHHLTRLAVLFRKVVHEHLDAALEHLRIAAFPISGMEIQMTAHGDGQFFRQHTDCGSRATAGRALTFVYYFYAEPKQHTGGELVFFGRQGAEHVVEPANDTLILFDPHIPHEVRPVSCPSGRFEDGRFTVNGWLRCRPAQARNTFFDRKIFTAVGSWPGMPAASRPYAGSPAPRLGSSARPAAGGAAAEALLALYADLQWTRRRPRSVDEYRHLPADDFFDRYFSANRPVVLRGAFSSSHAVTHWSPDYFAANYPDVPIDITAERRSVRDYERRFRETVRTVPFGEFAARLSQAAGNDFYLVARNNFFDNPGLRHLRDHLTPPAEIINDQDRSPGSAKLWMGPEGTVTPLHFDEHSILFAQIYGRKYFKLVPSADYRLIYPRDRYYSFVDPESVDLDCYPLFARACVMDVVLDPGDSLFLPAGWWHWVRSLSPSISATFSSFAVPGGNVRLRRFTRPARSVSAPRSRA
jgi:predicted 2-oxoglutarate/Fe(II)-dependent dioxygenase YbiX